MDSLEKGGHVGCFPVIPKIFSTTSHDHESLKRRQETFPATASSILATAGFLYKGSSGEVECDHCGVTVSISSQPKAALEEHHRNKPTCPFFSKFYKVVNTKPAKYPEYRELAARLDSFVSWPGQFVPQTPERLAAAGFFYIGSADRTTCFQCGLTLRDWEEDHDPETEHRNFSSDCTFNNKTNLNELGVAPRLPRKSLSSSPDTSDDEDLEEDSVGVAASLFNSDEYAVAAKGSVAEEGSVAGIVAGSVAGTEEVSYASVMTAKAMGFSDALVEKARKLMRQRHNKDCQSVTQFIDMILELETSVSHTEKKVNQKSSSYQTVCQSSSADDNHTSLSMNHTQFNHPVEAIKNPKSTTKKMPPLLAENKRLLDKKTCRICRQQDVCVLFLPCGHLVTCGTCADKVDACIACNKSILGTVKTYLT